MFKTFQGVTENAKNELYLRPETAQGIFVNFQNIQRTTRKKIPFGVGQVGKSFRNEITPGNFTFRTREFEPDAPNYTSRISGVVNPDGSYSLSILKNFTSDRTANKRFFYEYDKPVAGLGHFIHTYQCDGDPLPPFRGEPKCIRIELPIREFTNLLWNSLNEQNKVSLFVRYVDLETGEVEQEIRNKNAE